MRKALRYVDVLLVCMKRVSGIFTYYESVRKALRYIDMLLVCMKRVSGIFTYY